ncbi:unnamed protein product [Nezara viridula]|uniref:Uncharacterized protein n=1 Tax=Nezara viridula TaxID=85310 RepID=A0A9P0E2U9_NEZVI|nr:unnamed protein product [Nezara viridula]
MSIQCPSLVLIANCPAFPSSLSLSFSARASSYFLFSSFNSRSGMASTVVSTPEATLGWVPSRNSSFYKTAHTIDEVWTSQFLPSTLQLLRRVLFPLPLYLPRDILFHFFWSVSGPLFEVCYRTSAFSVPSNLARCSSCLCVLLKMAQLAANPSGDWVRAPDRKGMFIIGTPEFFVYEG